MLRFAVLDYVKDKNQIPVLFKIIKKAPDFIWDWYIKNFNPLIVKDIEFKELTGTFINLPVQKNDEQKKIYWSLKKALASFNNLEIIKPLDDFLFDYGSIKVAYGNFILAFLSPFLLKFLLKLIKKNLATAEIFILDGDRVLTQILLDSLYQKINYLTLVTDTKEFYLKKQSEIFADSGLNLQIINYNKSALSEPDIIFDTGLDKNFTYALKRNSIYFDLSKQNHISEIKIKRPDIHVIRNINLCYQENLIDNILLEMIFYCTSNSFKKIFCGEYSTKLFLAVKDKINKIKKEQITVKL